MGFSWRKWVAGFMGAAMLVLAAGCGGSSQPQQGGGQTPSDGQQTSGPKRGGTLRIVDEPPDGPFGLPWEIVAFGIIPNIPILEALVHVNWKGEISPWLAERWESDPENAAITLYLRKGVKFHDGTEFNAEAAKFNLEKNMEAGKLPLIESVEVVDDHTIRLHLTQWSNTIFVGLSGTASTMVSPSAIDANGIEWAREHPVGTGPFKFVRYERDQYVTYEPFEEYWEEGKPYLEGLELRFIRDPQTLKAAFLNGDVDAFGSGDTTLLREMIDQGFPYARGGSGIGISMIIPSSDNASTPFADKRVREAIYLSLNREDMAQALGNGLIDPAYQIAAPDTPAWLDDFQAPGYNPERAKQLLAEAGYPNGFSTRLIAPPFVDRETLVAIQNQLAQVGIQAEIETPEMARYVEYQTKGWTGMLVHPWGMFPNYNSLIQFYLVNPPEGFVSVRRPDGLRELWDRSQSTPEVDENLVKQLHRLLLDDFTVIPVGRSSRTYIFQPYVKDTGHLQQGTWPWWSPGNTWLDK